MILSNFYIIFFCLILAEGNDAIRQIRVLYDLHDTSSMRNSIKKFNTRMTFDEQRKFFNKPIPNVLYPWTTGQRILINHHHHHHNHPEKHFIYNRQSSQPSSLSLAMKSKDLSIIQLQRGRPMFTEIDFIPSKYTLRGKTNILMMIDRMLQGAKV